jgi:hypothetical protein
MPYPVLCCVSCENTPSWLSWGQGQWVHPTWHSRYRPGLMGLHKAEPGVFRVLKQKPTDCYMPTWATDFLFLHLADQRAPKNSTAIRVLEGHQCTGQSVRRGSAFCGWFFLFPVNEHRLCDCASADTERSRSIKSGLILRAADPGRASFTGGFPFLFHLEVLWWWLVHCVSLPACVNEQGIGLGVLTDTDSPSCLSSCLLSQRDTCLAPGDIYLWLSDLLLCPEKWLRQYLPCVCVESRPRESSLIVLVCCSRLQLPHLLQSQCRKSSCTLSTFRRGLLRYLRPEKT